MLISIFYRGDTSAFRVLLQFIQKQAMHRTCKNTCYNHFHKGQIIIVFNFKFMNKKALYWIVGIVVVVIVVIVAMSSGKSATAPSGAATSQSGNSNQPTASALRQSMRDLISSGVTKTCQFSIPATATSSSMSGMVYTASGNMRGDFTVTNHSGKVTSAHMIITGGIDYLWSDAMQKGIKLPWALAASSTSLSARAGVDISQPTSYSCTNAVPDQSEFTLPATIQFTDISAYIK